MPLQVPLVDNFGPFREGIGQLQNALRDLPRMQMEKLQIGEAQRHAQENQELQQLMARTPPDQSHAVAIRFLESKGRFEDADRLKAYDLEEFRSMATISPKAALEHYNKHFGTNYEYQPTKKDLISTKRGIFDPNKNEMTYPFPEKPDTTTEGKTVSVDGRIKQWNTKTKAYDIDLGASPDSIKATQPKQATNAIELFQQDPAKAEAYMRMDARIRSKFRLERSPSVAEFMTDLYKKDPETFNGVFNRVAPEKAEDRMLRILQLSKDPITGEIDSGTVEKITNLLKAGPMANDRTILLPSHGSGSRTASPGSTPSAPQALSGRRIRVRRADGKTGTIPAEQEPEARKPGSGYTILP